MHIAHRTYADTAVGKGIFISAGGDEREPERERGRRRAKADNVVVLGNSSLPTRSGSIPTLPSSRIAQLIKMEEPRRASLNSMSLKVSPADSLPLPARCLPDSSSPQTRICPRLDGLCWVGVCVVGWMGWGCVCVCVRVRLSLSLCCAGG